ncbi:MAG: hypothetical protein WCV84_04285 [Patescibacteria group bacterium]
MIGLLHLWHSLLNMPKYDRAWHEQDIADELKEYNDAHDTFLHRWSELSDVAYTYTRARWSGHDFPRPLPLHLFLIGVLYMIPKISLRWWFYRIAGKRTNPHARLHEVRNPKKIEKVRVISENYHLDTIRFEQECRKLLRWWPLLD